jgi:exodeoxyribonuclease-3
VTLRFISYNIRYGGTGRESALADVIRACDPDVVVLQEATDPGVIARVAKRAGFDQWGSRAGYSTGFLSRVPVRQHAWHSARGARHPYLEIVLDGPYPRIFGLHLSAWFSKWSERRRAREIRLLLDGIREHQDGFHLIAGDFNALAPGARLQLAQMPRWIRAMVWVSGRDIARDTIQVMLDERYADVWRRHHPVGDGYTFPTWGAHVRLDYIFTPDRYANQVTECRVMTDVAQAPAASDHYPLFALLTTGRSPVAGRQ